MKPPEKSRCIEVVVEEKKGWVLTERWREGKINEWNDRLRVKCLGGHGRREGKGWASASNQHKFIRYCTVVHSSSMNVHSTSPLHKLPFHAAWQISRSSRARESLQSHLTKLHWNWPCRRIAGITLCLIQSNHRPFGGWVALHGPFYQSDRPNLLLLKVFILSRTPELYISVTCDVKIFVFVGTQQMYNNL
jgi:hypothetical protein